MRLASLNLFSGRLPDARPGPAVGPVVAGLGADVIALQEVDVAQPRSDSVDQVLRAAAATGAVDWRFVPTVLGTPGAVWSAAAPGPGSGPGDPAADGPRYGIAMVSRLPVKAWHTLDLGPSGPRRMPVPERWRWVRDEPRVAVAAQLDGLTVACTHLTVVPGLNVAQLRRVVRWLETLPGPRVLLGDLNLPAPLPARITGWTPLVTARTFPAVAPRIQLDHALAETAVEAKGEAVRLPLSDHLGLVVDVF